MLIKYRPASTTQHQSALPKAVLFASTTKSAAFEMAGNGQIVREALSHLIWYEIFSISLLHSTESYAVS